MAFVIIALLMAGALIPLSTQIEVRNIGDTRRVMDQIKEALTGFAQVNGRLPCPANGALTSSNSAAGTELYDGTRCTAVIGVVPWVTLGVPETDAWNRRFTYRVASAFADNPSTTVTYTTSTATNNPAPPATQTACTVSPTPSLASFASCALGEIAVLTPSYSDHSVYAAVGTGLPAVFVSHGKNGFGAWQSSGVQLSVTAATNEAGNSSTGNTSLTTVQAPALPYTSNVFYSRELTASASGCSDTSGTLFCEYDDIVYMISTPTLVSRMVSAGRFP